ncbi:F-box domain-containing protein [Heracleum sosnowskyi]|uniref:F-box domain-containing protein n=1 Tax=Heracleum sosnowskyi TaxID=360622 RepID=A0AAD8H0Y4_9APIA|nr:F-box domain-containing protein [Heracleum sosnowskyi]
MASIDHLVEEMIFKILSLLPVLTLLRCKSVCKSWKTIISDPHFIQAHLTISHNKPPPFSLLRVVPRGKLQGLYIHTHGEDSVKLTLPVPEYMCGMHLYVRSCNGLVTLADRSISVLYIWNPLTRLFKLILPSKIFPHYSNVGFAKNLGFGFDSVSNDYKILRVVLGGYSYSGGNVSVMVAELYSVNADSWKEIRIPNEMHGFKSNLILPCVCVDSGVLYFEGVEEILSFDLHDEVFGLFQYPNSGGKKSCLLNVDSSPAVIMESGGGGSALSLWKLDGVADKV